MLPVLGGGSGVYNLCSVPPGHEPLLAVGGRGWASGVVQRLRLGLQLACHCARLAAGSQSACECVWRIVISDLVCLV